MWEVDHKEGWVPKNGCFQTVVLEKTFESSLYSKEIQPVNHKGIQPWIFIGRTDAETEIPILWSPDAKNWLIGKDPDGWLVKIEGGRRRGWQRLDGITDSVHMSLSSGRWWRTRKPAFHGVRVRHVQLSGWTTVSADGHSTYLCTLWFQGWIQLPFVKYLEHCLGIVKVLYLLSR